MQANSQRMQLNMMCNQVENTVSFTVSFYALTGLHYVGQTRQILANLRNCPCFTAEHR